MHLENLYLEVTRNCTIECEHCFRGEREKVNMNPSTLSLIFKDIRRIDFLLLTGGEPLLAIQALEQLAELLKTKQVHVGKILLITNGTVLSERVLRVLHAFQDYSYLVLKVSMNVFHDLALQECGLLELRNRNLQVLFQEGFYNFSEYGKDEHSPYGIGLVQKGRAKTLTPERLEEINALVTQKFSILPYSSSEKLNPASRSDTAVSGVVSIDVYGNLVGYELSFEEEDQYAYDHGISVLDMPFSDAVDAFIRVNDEKLALQRQELEMRLKKIVK